MKSHLDPADSGLEHSKHSGLLSYGSYVPRRRLQRSSIYNTNKWFAPELGGLAKGEKAISNWDEDPITMAVEAARCCLLEMDRSAIESLSLSSTTLPFADRSNCGVIKEALNLDDTVSVSDRTGNLRAATSALMEALEGSRTHLCLAADRRKARVASAQELNYGDAASCVLVGAGDAIANYLGGISTSIDFVDHFRASHSEFDYAWEARFTRDEGFQKILGESIKNTLDKLNLDGGQIDHAVIVVPVRGVAQKLSVAAGINVDAVADVLLADIGDSGVAHPLLMLNTVLAKAKAGEKILLASFGQGADVMVFETTEQINTMNAAQVTSQSERTSDENYSRYLFHRGLLDIEKGMRAELDEKQPGTTLARDRKTVLGLVGGRCTKTGTVQYPKTDLLVGTTERLLNTQEDYPFAERRAKILSFTADRLSYYPDPPMYYGMIDFAGGGRMVVTFADVEGEEIDVGAEVRMVFRIKAVDEKRGFTKYYWKAIAIQRGGA